MKELQTTLLFIIKNGKILLGEKKRGFAAGIINGIGGKQTPGETIEDTLIRETFEEINVKPLQYEKVAVIICNPIIEKDTCKETMHVFFAKDYEGTIKESDEMRPFWCDLDKIPFDKMFPDDKLWLEKVLKGEKLHAILDFDKDFKIINYKFTELNDN